MEELSCPRCRMTKYRNPALQLMINICGHPLCKSCVDVVFARESAPCPDCGRTLRRSGFRTQVFEDTRVDKEVDIRKSVMKIYNKLESDFPTLRDYNDYLEEVEAIIWNLESGVNERETREKMAEYKMENEALIRRNQIRFNQERAYFKDTQAREAKEREARAQMRSKLDKEEDEARRKLEEEFLQELKSNSHLTAEELLERRRKFEAENAAKKSSGDRMSIDVYVNTNTNDDVSATDADSGDQIPATDYVYHEEVMDIAGPDMPESRDLWDGGYMNHVRQATQRDMGGGYSSLISCQRALCDAFGGLFATPEATATGVM
uniref:CDK-activating kinase assembly factor MAT1 n=1 Tax=Phallusia mammillata TaxID=59560 RepID=A0A6F9DKA3_9ASCI|nr:CDK-activating kinase assembly factor MAT1 [Phallusia mammillata]